MLFELIDTSEEKRPRVKVYLELLNCCYEMMNEGKKETKEYDDLYEFLEQYMKRFLRCVQEV